MVFFIDQKTIAAAFIAGSAITSAAQAATLTSASATTSSPSFSDSDAAGPQAGNSSAAVAGASATQNTDGSSTVSAESSTQFAGGREINTATATLTQTATNNSGALQGYEFSFTLFDLALQIQETHGYSPYFNYANPFAGPDSDAAANRISYTVNLNGNTIFEAGIELWGGIDAGFNVTNVENFSYTQIDILDPFNGTDVIGSRIEIDDLEQTLFLGNFADGAELELETILFAESRATNYEGEQSSGGKFGDPSGLTSRTLLAQVAPQVGTVPLPAAGWMLLAGLGGLAAAGKRRKS